MSTALELHDSRIDGVENIDGDARVHFSHAYIHKSKGAPGRNSGSGWSQEAVLIITGAVSMGQLPPRPNTITDGYLEVGGIKHTSLPLPFSRNAAVSLTLVFDDGTSLDLYGRGAAVELLGKAIYLEDF